MDVIVVLITTSSQDEAKKIGEHLVETRLAACVNIVSDIHSIFFWEGKRCTASESLLLVKTQRSLFEPLCDAVRTRHSYTIPEIIALPIIAGFPGYLQWVAENTR